jgi:arylformamidase
MVYHGMNQAELDAAYNNSLAVADSNALLRGFDERSAAIRKVHARFFDLRYGPAPRNRIDYFAADKPGPLLIFIHGGYWQMRAKETFSFVAAGPLAHGIHVALVGYTLAPDISVTGIVDEVRAAISWLRSHAQECGWDGKTIILSGWSAGGHLTAMCLDEPGIAGGIAISGIFDMEPIRLSYLNRKLKLAGDEVGSLSPLRFPLSRRPLVIAYGTEELQELQNQSMRFAAARENLPGCLLPLADHNHFTILEEFSSPEGSLTRQVRALTKASNPQ